MQPESEFPKSATNDVFSDTFESKLDPAFRSDFKGDWKWNEVARSRPRLVELGMVWDNKVTRKV